MPFRMRQMVRSGASANRSSEAIARSVSAETRSSVQTGYLGDTLHLKAPLNDLNGGEHPVLAKHPECVLQIQQEEFHVAISKRNGGMGLAHDGPLSIQFEEAAD